MSYQVLFCEEANADHKHCKRLYAHTFHNASNVICVCDAIVYLPDEHFAGILAHEIGHLIAGYDADEDEANKIAEKRFGQSIEYKRHTDYGNDLEITNDPQLLFEQLKDYLEPESYEELIEPRLEEDEDREIE